MNIIDCIQGSPEWHAARLGKITASRITDVMATLKSGGEAAGRKNYRAQLVVERMTDQTAESYMNAAMQWGVDNETPARECYEFLTGVQVEQVGFVNHPAIPMCGASPDGLVDDDGLVEIKCPNTATHIEYLLSGGVPADYVKQMLWQMACTDRKWCDFVSYDPRMPIDLQLFTVRLLWDDVAIKQIQDAVILFLAEVDAMVAKLNGLRK